MTAVVALRNDFVIFSCFWMKTESALVRAERPWTAAMPVPEHTYVNQGVVLESQKRAVYEPMSARKIRNGSKITRKLRSQTTKQRCSWKDVRALAQPAERTDGERNTMMRSRLTMKASKRIVLMRYRDVLIKLNAEATLA